YRYIRMFGLLPPSNMFLNDSQGLCGIPHISSAGWVVQGPPDAMLCLSLCRISLEEYTAMSRWIQVDEEVNRYITDHLEPEIEVLQALRRETSRLQGSQMQISHEQARFMSVILQSMQVQRSIEIG